MLHRRRAFTGMLALTLIAAACGGDDGGNAETATVDTAADAVKAEIGKLDVGGTTTTAAGSTATSTAAPTKEPANMAEWEKLWATERAAAVKRIKDNTWGLQADGKTVLGPEGFTVDLSKCAAGWSNTEGLTDTEIKVGQHTILSGPLADAGNISKAAQAMLAYYNGQGLFKDSVGKTRNVNLILKDDGYDPARAIPIVDEFLDSTKVFSVWGLGTPSIMKTYDKINQRCVPHPFAVTGHPAWGDPVNHPWTSGVLLAYNTEAVLWGAFIDQHIAELTAPDGKATIAALIMNNDFGKAYDSGFKTYLASSPNKDKIEYVTETIEPAAPTVTDAMTNLGAKNPEMFIQMLAGIPCAQTVTEVAQNGMREKAKFLMAASVCKNQTYFGEKAVGNSSEGWWVMGGGIRDMVSPASDTNAWIVWARDMLKTSGYDYKTSGGFGQGSVLGWGYAQLLAVAGQLDGGLTRANMLVAGRSLSMTHPGYLTGIKWNVNGNKDAYWIEGTEVGKYDFAKQSFVQQGDIIELSGKSTNCAWDQSVANCK